MNRIDELFARLKREGRTALMPFLTAGDPDLGTTEALIRRFVAEGADLIELGIPYSDPIADGPVIAASYARALMRGTKLDDVFCMVRELRGVLSTPLVTMVSYSIVHRRGIADYLDEAASAGIDGLIVPDLPVEEAEGLFDQASARGLGLIQLVTPRTPRDRARSIVRSTTGFLYYVSVAGITGERTALPPDLVDNIHWLRSETDLPIAIGFGIGSSDQVRALAPLADGLIVGSAIVRRIADARGLHQDVLVRDLGEFVGELSSARSRAV